MTETQQQGRQAKQNGRILEQTILPLLQAKGFVPVSYSDYQRSPENFAGELVLTHVPYTTIYGASGYSEFVIRSNSRNLLIRVECKWQQAQGSVDEKFPFVYLNAIEAYPESMVFLIVDGGGARQGAVDWLKSAVRQKRFRREECAKDIRVLSVAEFIAWGTTHL